MKSGNRFHKLFSPALSTGAAALITLAATPAAADGVAPARLERLSRGINASHWFAQVFAREGYGPEHFRNYFGRRDAQFIANSGLKHVRLSVEPKGLFDPDTPGTLGGERLAELDRAIRMLLSCRLAVIVDIHTYGEFIDKLADDNAHLDAVAKFWEALAAHLKQYDPEYLYLELLNEPQIRSAARWQLIAGTLAGAARRGAPEHTLIVTGKEWSNIDDLLVLKPLSDRNIVYNFHFYEPGVFTHQGAGWSYPPWAKVRGVPYPVTPEILKASGASAGDESGRKALEQYARERWNAAKIASRIEKMAAWGRKHSVPLTCNEFGVYIRYAPAADRLRYLSDTRRALEKAGIGWTMWDYAENFRLVKPREGGRVDFDDGLSEALGLR
ncbi:MAG: cellulase family glycosylhydrolase [Lentisphaeria bacterium]|nr:cellulase family glycosylhydrolase [Lentisphaeria bacterium]